MRISFCFTPDTLLTCTMHIPHISITSAKKVTYYPVSVSLFDCYFMQKLFYHVFMEILPQMSI